MVMICGRQLGATVIESRYIFYDLSTMNQLINESCFRRKHVLLIFKFVSVICRRDTGVIKYTNFFMSYTSILSVITSEDVSSVSNFWKKWHEEETLRQIIFKLVNLRLWVTMEFEYAVENKLVSTERETSLSG